MPPRESPNQPFVVPKDQLSKFTPLSIEETAKLIESNQPKGTKEKDPERADLQEAREILGNDFLGPEQVQQVFETALTPDQIPALPYSREDLEKAKERGEMLVLRIDKDVDGHPLTMERIHTLLERPSIQAGKGKILHKVDWYINEPFFKVDTAGLEWKLVSKEVLPDSTGKNYIDQTKVLRDSLREFLTPQELTECSDQKLEESRELMSTDWKEAAQQLSELQINKNHRRKPVEALYDLSLRFGAKDERLLQGKYDWSCIRSSGGDLVHVGNFGAKGANVDGWEPDSASGDLGIVSSR